MKLFSEVWNEYKELYGKQVFSMMNGAFFEDYKASTQILILTVNKGTLDEAADLLRNLGVKGIF